MLKGAACTNHSDPDLWFPEYPSHKPSAEQIEVLVDRTIYALTICNQCPVKQECLDIGMRYVNIEQGIWGGTLPGERLVAAGRSLKYKHAGDAVVFAERVRDRIKVWESMS